MTNQSTLIIKHLSAIIRLKNFDQTSNFVDEVGTKICQLLQLNIVKKTHTVFEPIGLTLVYILSQSHIAFHTWPEFNTLHIDLVSCRLIEKDEFDQAVKQAVEHLGIEEYKSELHAM